MLNCIDHDGKGQVLSVAVSGKVGPNKTAAAGVTKEQPGLVPDVVADGMLLDVR